MKSFAITVCASGGGGNFQALIDARDEMEFEINCLIVDRDCGAIDRAIRAGIPVRKVRRSYEALRIDLDNAIPETTNLLVFAGFLSIMPKVICTKWEGRVINIHPSLLPKFGGKGMYGVRVHEAVMSAREKVTGCTVHFVTGEIDGGEIILQKSIEVDYKQTPWQLGGRVFIEENKLLPEAIKLLRSSLKLTGS